MRDKLFRWWAGNGAWADLLVAWLVVLSVALMPSYQAGLLGMMVVVALIRVQFVYRWQVLAQHATDLTEKVLAINERLIAQLPAEKPIVH